jgi:hypothetical protein
VKFLKIGNEIINPDYVVGVTYDPEHSVDRFTGQLVAKGWSGATFYCSRSWIHLAAPPVSAASMNSWQPPTYRNYTGSKPPTESSAGWQLNPVCLTVFGKTADAVWAWFCKNAQEIVDVIDPNEEPAP